MKAAVRPSSVRAVSVVVKQVPGVPEAWAAERTQIRSVAFHLILYAPSRTLSMAVRVSNWVAIKVVRLVPDGSFGSSGVRQEGKRRTRQAAMGKNLRVIYMVIVQ